MGSLDGRVAIVTGAGRGLGREHALLLAREGARVVVNDVGSAGDGSGKDPAPAQLVVDEIRALGGAAVANTDGVSDWNAGERLVRTAIDEFGDLDILVNNAGILRDRMLVNMDEAAWDAVIDVHLKGTFVPTRHAAAYWRERSKTVGRPVGASVVCTSSWAGLYHNVGQANYGAAKAGIAAFAMITAKELARYGVRVNAVVPVARTRGTAATPGLGQVLREPENPAMFDPWSPANVSPLVAYLATEECPFSGGVWQVAGGSIGLFEGWQIVADVDKKSRWTVAELRREVVRLAGHRLDLEGQLPSEGGSLPGLIQALMP